MRFHTNLISIEDVELLFSVLHHFPSVKELPLFSVSLSLTIFAHYSLNVLSTSNPRTVLVSQTPTPENFLMRKANSGSPCHQSATRNATSYATRTP
jgi:hypothetical protein